MNKDGERSNDHTNMVARDEVSRMRGDDEGTAAEEPTSGTDAAIATKASDVRASEDQDMDTHQEVPTDDGWQELMGSELVMKTFSLSDDNDNHDDTAVQPQDAVIVSFTGRHAASRDDATGPVFQCLPHATIIIGDKDVVPAVEMGVRFMRVDTTAVVYSTAKYAYGPLSRQHDGYVLPAHANVRYEITVHSIVSAATRATPSFAMQLAKSRKSAGNDAYTHEWSSGAGWQRPKQLYEQAARGLEYLVVSAPPLPECSAELQAEAREIFVDCLNNVVAVLLRAQQYHAAKQAAVRVLEQDAHNVKALIRAAKAALYDPASSFVEVQAALAAAVAQAPHHAELPRLRRELQRRQQQYARQQKAMFGNILGGVGANDAKHRATDGDNDDPTDDPAEAAGQKTHEEVPQDPIINATSRQDQSSFSTNLSNLSWRDWSWREKIWPFVWQLVVPLCLTFAVIMMKRLQRQAQEIQ